MKISEQTIPPLETKESPDQKKKVQNRSLESIPSGIWWRSALTGAAAIALGFGFLEAIRLLARPLALFALGLALAAALAPLVRLFQLNLKFPRSLAVVFVYLILLGIFIFIGSIVIPTLVSQFTQAIARLPDLVSLIQSTIDRWAFIKNPSVMNTFSSQLGSLGGVLINLPLQVTSSIFDILLVIFVSIYSLIGSESMRKFLLSLFRPDTQDKVNQVSAMMAESMGGYIRATLINGLIIGVLTYVGLLIIGMNFPLVLGLFAGVMEMVPVLGPILAAIPIVGLAFLQSDKLAVIVLVYFIAIQQFENHILVPNIMKSQTDLPPILGILSIFTGGLLGGMIGALVAIPFASAVRVFFKLVLIPAIQRETGAVVVEESEKGEVEE